MLAALCLIVALAQGQSTTAQPVEGDVTLKNFTFTSGEKLSELRIH